MTNSAKRNQDIQDLLESYSDCQGKTFSCQDSSLHIDKFEQDSTADYQPRMDENIETVGILLKLRARIDIRIKIARMIIRRLTV